MVVIDLLKAGECKLVVLSVLCNVCLVSLWFWASASWNICRYARFRECLVGICLVVRAWVLWSDGDGMFRLMSWSMFIGIWPLIVLEEFGSLCWWLAVLLENDLYSTGNCGPSGVLGAAAAWCCWEGNIVLLALCKDELGAAACAPGAWAAPLVGLVVFSYCWCWPKVTYCPP